MLDRFQNLLNLEREFQRLSKLRDELIDEEDAETTGFKLATVLSKIATIEKQIGDLRKSPATT